MIRSRTLVGALGFERARVPTGCNVRMSYLGNGVCPCVHCRPRDVPPASTLEHFASNPSLHFDRFLLHPSFPSRCTAILAAEDIRIAHSSPADITSTRRLEKPSFHVTHDVHGTSQVGSLFGTIFYFCWIRILLYIGSFDPLSCVPLSSFRSRPPALHASFPSAIERRRILIDPAPAVSC